MAPYGLSERAFLSCYYASFKQAYKFVGWTKGKGEHYYHPFTTPIGYGTVNAAQHWSGSVKDGNFENWVCAKGTIFERNLSPKLPQMPEYAFNLNYGYHLNAEKFVSMLHEHCVGILGVNYMQGHVANVTSEPNGDIATVVLANGESIEGDLFIDCSGFGAVLIGKHYQIPFISKQHILFNDTALALQVEHACDEVPIASCTVATAQKSGWIWDIALQNRRGIGHVFSSDFTSADEAENALLRYVQNDPYLAKQEITPRCIKFIPGHRSSF